MTAYVIAEVDVTDPEQYEAYRQLSPTAISAAGGRFVVRGGTCVTLEGDWAPPRVVLIEFPTLEMAKAFYDSPLYREARAAREGAARMKIIAVEGV